VTGDYFGLGTGETDRQIERLDGAGQGTAVVDVDISNSYSPGCQPFSRALSMA